MNIVFVIFILLVLAGGVTATGWLVISHSTQNLQLSPKKVAEQITQLYREDRVDEVQALLTEKTSDWEQKDWQKFHKERDKQLGSAKDNQSQINAELETLKEFKNSDKRIEAAKDELKNKPQIEQQKWDEKFKNELE